MYMKQRKIPNCTKDNIAIFTNFYKYNYIKHTSIKYKCLYFFVWIIEGLHDRNEQELSCRVQECVKFLKEFLKYEIV